MPYLGLITVLVMIAALVDIVGSEESSIRGLPRSGWILLVVAVPLAGAVVWVIAGRPRAAFSGRIGEVDDPRPKRAVETGATDTDAEEEFRRRVRERADEQRRRAETERRDQES
jgi:hypothetical protein